MDWLALSLVCAFSMASADALTKRLLADYTAQELVVVRFGFTAVLMAPLLLLQPWPALPGPFWAWVVAMVPLEILAMWLYMRAIRRDPLALTLPYLAFTPVFVVITGYVLLGERVTLLGLSGILLVVAGAYLLNLQHLTGRDTWLAPLRAIAQQRGSRLMLAVAALYSLTSVMGKSVLQYVTPSFFAPFYFCVLAVAALGLGTGARRPVIALLWRRPGAHFAVGITMAVMILTHLAAIQLVEVAYMIAVKRTSLLFGILYGAVLFQETHAARHFIAGALMVTGVGLIAL